MSREQTRRHKPSCASLERLHDPGPEGEGNLRRTRLPCDCGVTDREQTRRDAGSWECRESEIPGESYIERGTGALTERFLDSPLAYPDAEKVEAVLAELEQAEEKSAWYERQMTIYSDKLTRTERELEQAERQLEQGGLIKAEREEWKATLEQAEAEIVRLSRNLVATHEHLEQAERERDEARHQLGALITGYEARLAKVPALVEALRAIAEGRWAVGGPQEYTNDARAFARDVLAAWEEA